MQDGLRKSFLLYLLCLITRTSKGNTASDEYNDDFLFAFVLWSQNGTLPHFSIQPHRNEETVPVSQSSFENGSFSSRLEEKAVGCVPLSSGKPKHLFS